MVPFDSRSPFLTSGLRFGTPAITTRGVKENLMGDIVEMIDTVLSKHEAAAAIKSVREKVNQMMKDFHFLDGNIIFSKYLKRRQKFIF